MKRSTVRVTLLFACVGCNNGDELLCVVPPCVAAAAITVSVMSGTAGILPGAFVNYAGLSTPMLCASAPNNVCVIMGGGGKYEFDVGATGYTTEHRTVTVTETPGGCGQCSQVATQHVEVILKTSGQS